MEPKPAGRPLKFQSVEELQEKILAYFDSCMDYKRDMFGNRLADKDDPEYRPPKYSGKGKDKMIMDKGNPCWLMRQVKPFTITGLAVYLDTTRDTLLDYESGKYDDPEKSAELNDTFSDTIKKAKAMIYAYAEEQLFSGKQAAGPIFNLKNNWQWKDEHDLTSGGRPLGAVPIWQFKHANTTTETGDESEVPDQSQAS